MKFYLQNRMVILARKYEGRSLESGGTSIQGGAAPSLKIIASKFPPGAKILDYGAGKYARNADFLRKNGHEVYAYDPYNGGGGDGWAQGTVSSKLPSDITFDVGFTAYVLNVVPEKIEKHIVSEVRQHCRKSYHITRNMDIFASIKKALLRQDKLVAGFYFSEYLQQPAHNLSDITDEEILEFCKFGVQTSRGFQRIPETEDFGFHLIKNTSGFKIYAG